MTKPTTMPIAADPPLFNPEPEVCIGGEFAIILVPSVVFAVGFSVGIDGRGTVELPAADELVGVGEAMGGGEEAEGTEGGGDGVVELGGTFVEGGEGGGASKGVLSGGFPCGGGGEVEDGCVGTSIGGGGGGGEGEMC